MSMTAPAGVRVTAGVDWAKDDHVVCVLDEQREAIERFSVAHDAPGLKQACRLLLRVGVGDVGIERGDGPLVEALLCAGLRLYVIPPGQVKNLRSRYGSAGNNVGFQKS
jgi:Transposase